MRNFIYLLLLFVKRSIVLASSEICTFFIHSKCIPCCRTEDIFLRYIVHANRDSQHRAHCDQICTDVSVGDCTVVSTPVVHNIVCTLECTVFAIASRNEPCAWPCVVCTFPKCIRYYLPEVLLSILLRSEEPVQVLLQGSDGSL